MNYPLSNLISHLNLIVCWYRFCPAAACCRRPACSCTVPTWSLQRRSWCCVRRRRVTATTGTRKTVTVQSCWSMLARVARTGYLFMAGWRGASAVSLSDSVMVSCTPWSCINNLNVSCVQSPSVRLGCSTVNAPSPALQPAIVSTSRRSARKSVWMAVHALVTSRSLYLLLLLTLCYLQCWHGVHLSHSG